MATTTNYGWETPDDTDLVKDGALAMRTTGSAIDTTLYTINAGSAKVGMHLINATTFTTASAVSLNNVFSATYDSYRIKFLMTSCTANGNLYMHVRAGGTDLSSGNVYAYAGWYAGSGGASGMAGYNVGGNEMIVGYHNNVVPRLTSNIELDLPYVATTTLMTYSGQGYDGSNYVSRNGGGEVVNTGQYDGFTIFPSSGTLTGMVKVYGYRNS